MNWYKKAQYAKKKNQWSWEMFLKGISLGIFGTIALELLAVNNWDNIKNIYEKNKNLFEQNPASASQEVQQDFENLNITQQQQGQNVSINNKNVAPKGETVEKTIIRHEGKRNKVYRDTKGIPTIGIGFNLNRGDAKNKIEALGLNYNDVLNGKQSLTDAQINILYKNDINSAKRIARNFISNFDQHPLSIQNVLINMAFNMGAETLSEFQNFKKDIENKNYQSAATRMEKSKWYGQVGSRSKELVNIVKNTIKSFLSGNWFKKIGQEVIENPKDIDYEDIGHTQNPEKESLEEGRENYLWVYVPKEDRVYSVKEDNKNSSHDGSVLTNFLPYSSYLGRYDVIAKKLSISFNIRQQGSWEISAYKDIPEEVLSALRREFPDTQYVYFFGHNLT